MVSVIVCPDTNIIIYSNFITLKILINEKKKKKSQMVCIGFNGNFSDFTKVYSTVTPKKVSSV